MNLYWGRWNPPLCGMVRYSAIVASAPQLGQLTAWRGATTVGVAVALATPSVDLRRGWPSR